VEFPQTTWSVLRQLRPGSGEHRPLMEKLCRRYWTPIRDYARAAWARDEHEADDLAQEFFVWLFEGDVLARYASERGSFRNYMKGLLRNFGRNFRRASRRHERVGGEPTVPLDAAAPVADRRSEEAESGFDRAFARQVMAHAVERLRARFVGGPREVQWRLYEEYDLVAENARPTYAALAERHGLGEGNVRTHLHRVRNLLKEEVRRELAETVATSDELDEEWRLVVG